MAPRRDLVIDPVFVEAELPPPALPGKFMAKTWGVFARCSWWMGHARGRESRPEAEARAGAAVDRLIEAAAAGPVVLCAHGWFNRMMRPHLRSRRPRSEWRPPRTRPLCPRRVTCTSADVRTHAESAEGHEAGQVAGRR